MSDLDDAVLPPELAQQLALRAEVDQLGEAFREQVRQAVWLHAQLAVGNVLLAIQDCGSGQGISEVAAAVREQGRQVLDDVRKACGE